MRFKDRVFVLETMYWPDEIRAAEFETLDVDSRARPQEVEMARTLIESLTEPWNPGVYKDEYREALLDIVGKKVAGEPIEAPAEAPPAKVVDLMEALKASVEAARKRTPGAKRTGSRRSTAKKPAAPKRKAATG